MKYIVYGLVDPRDNQLFYIGKSCSGMKRPVSHMSHSVLARTPRDRRRKIESILDDGLDPVIVILRSCKDKHELRLAETVLICTLSKSSPLLNDKLNRRRYK